MPIFQITAYQEMFTIETVEAYTEDEAQALFIERFENGSLTWKASAEEIEIAEIVSDDDVE